jgi:LysM domain
MGAMRTRTPILLALAVAACLAACVPDPVGRGQPGSIAVPTASPTPDPTPAGPTPSPSFVRPTPRPLPTFLIHVVAAGESLVKIARRYGTSVESIAYWNRARYPSLDPDSRGYRPDYLVVGWSLDIIPDHEVDPEDLPDATEPVPGSTVEPEDLPDESVFEG